MNDEDLARCKQSIQEELRPPDEDRAETKEKLRQMQGFFGPPTTSYRTSGGLSFEMTRCCNASVTWTQGGVVWKVCSKCGRRVEPEVYG